MAASANIARSQVRPDLGCEMIMLSRASQRSNGVWQCNRARARVTRAAAEGRPPAFVVSPFELPRTPTNSDMRISIRKRDWRLHAITSLGQGAPKTPLNGIYLMRQPSLFAALGKIFVTDPNTSIKRCEFAPF